MLYNNDVVYMNSPIDYIEIQCDKEGITSVEFVKEKRYSEQSNAILEAAKKQLEEYFSGKRRIFDLPIKVMGTNFQQRVWKELMNISYGETLSYGEIARNIDNPKASRAVGNANNRNQIAIIIPCHRVIGANGKLVGYGGGVWRKQWLLQHETKYNK